MGGFSIVKLTDPIQFTNVAGGLVPRGAYVGATDYGVGDSVDYLGSSYVMFSNAVAGTLPTNTTFWQVLAGKGDAGSAALATTNAAELTSGVLANARVQQTNVTQHQAALSVTASQVSDFGASVSGNSAVTANTAKNSYPSGDATKVGHITVTQAVNLDTMESDIATNNAKVTNATHTGDATGATALTLATVNSNVGSFTNADVTVNAKGLITAVSNGAGGGGGGISDGDKGDITVSASGATWTIDAGVVTNAKSANMTTKTYKGRTAGTTGAPEDVAVATLKTDLQLVKADVGLANVDNTSNATERAATATLTNKTLTSPVINTPTGIVKADVGLANVDNTTDAAKPVSTAQQTAIDAKVADAINNNTTTIAPSQNAVFDALALKADDSAAVKLTGTQTIAGAKTFSTPIAPASVQTMSASVGGGVPTPPNNTTTFLRGDGTFATPAGSGDMILASTQTNSGLKTFLTSTFGLRNVANTFTALFTNTITAARTYTLKDADGTIAFTSDITGTNSGTNTGDQTITLTGGVTGSGTGSFAATVVTNANLTGVVTSTGNATAIANTAITNAMLANGAVANLTGTNSGDNATNSQYSGLVSNATHTGDATGATSLTLATVNANVGAFGSATQVATPTVNAKGLVTAVSNTTIAIPSTAITDFAAGVAATASVTANTAKITNATHTGEVTGSTALTIANNAVIAARIADNAVTNAKAAQMATKTYKGRTTTGTGNSEDVAVATLKTDLQLVKADVGLANVDNTSNATERAATATLTNKTLTDGTNVFPTFNQNTTGSAATLTTARTIAGVSFNGSANITVASTNLSDTASIVLLTSAQTITDKRITLRTNTITSSATPAINSDTTDEFTITALAANITSMTSSLTGTPTNGQELMVRIKGTATRTITWGASFVSSGTATLLATTSGTNTHYIKLRYDTAAAKFVCLAVDAVGYA